MALTASKSLPALVDVTVWIPRSAIMRWALAFCRSQISRASRSPK